MTHTNAPTPAAAPRTITLTSLDAAQEVLAAATQADGIAPISDGLLEAAADGSAVILGIVDVPSDTATAGGPDSPDVPLAGVGVAALQGERWAAEAVVTPEHRRRGLGRALVAALTEAARASGGDPWFWSHGDHPAASHLAEESGRRRARELLQLTTDGAPTLPAATVPDGVVLRDVRPDDADAWAAVNNAAFSWHPEQGGQDPADYRRRTGESDFDPRTVVIAERTDDGRVLGFHETKRHAEHPSGLAMGEVHVIGVDPEVHARGLGRALLVEGMSRMIADGAEAIELYVESDNEKALPLYRDVGFSRTVVHVSYEPPESPHD